MCNHPMGAALYTSISMVSGFADGRPRVDVQERGWQLVYGRLDGLLYVQWVVLARRAAARESVLPCLICTQGCMYQMDACMDGWMNDWMYILCFTGVATHECICLLEECSECEHRWCIEKRSATRPP
jgi:hypothetical protein